MNTRRGFIMFFGAAAFGSLAVIGSTSANAGGLLGDIANQVYPGVGTAMDAWSREWQKRDSDASVGSQILGSHIPDTPFRAARPAPAPAPMGPPPVYGGPVYGAPPMYAGPAYGPPPIYRPAPMYAGPAYGPPPVIAGPVYGAPPIMPYRHF
jgi:hypothetical protein